MSTSLHRLTPSTLQLVRDELVGQRFLDRDLACVALQCCKDCEFYGTLEKRPLVVLPSEGTKPGWILSDAPTADSDDPAVKGTSADSDPDPEPTAKEESQAPDSADRDDPLI